MRGRYLVDGAPLIVYGSENDFKRVTFPKPAMNDSKSIEPSPLAQAGPKRVWRIWVFASIAVVIALMIPSYFVLKWLLTVARAPQALGKQGSSVVIASFLTDFQPNQPKQGWHYYWNENGPIGR